MFGWFRRKPKPATPSPARRRSLSAPAGPQPPAADNPFVRLQTDYWRPNPAEQAALIACGVENLSWPERLRLHHLACADLFHQSGAATADPDAAEDTEGAAADAPAWPAAELAARMAGLLASDDSPYRPRHASLWTGPAGGMDRGEPGVHGVVRNASVTHAGCLEAVRVDDQLRPLGLTFIPFDDVRGLLLSRPSLFRAAKVLYEGGRPDEIVCLPLLYGFSWSTGRAYDTDGTLTRFCCYLRVPALGMYSGIGIGHQDLAVEVKGGGASLVGLGSAGELAMALSVTDPRFDEKCRGRGIDPDDARRQAGYEKPPTP